MSKKASHFQGAPPRGREVNQYYSRGREHIKDIGKQKMQWAQREEGPAQPREVFLWLGASRRRGYRS